MLRVIGSDCVYTSIRQALTADLPFDETLILLLRMEVHEENVVIDRPHVRLIGEARLRTILQGDAPLTITAPDVQVENLTVRTLHADGRNEDIVYTASEETHTAACFICGDEHLQPLPAEVTAGRDVHQLRKAGESVKSFVSTKQLGFVELCLRPGDRLVVALGVHDADQDLTHHSHPYLTYPLYLQMFVDAARRCGAEPLLVIPYGMPRAYAMTMEAMAVRQRIELIRQDEPVVLHPELQRGDDRYDPLRL